MKSGTADQKPITLCQLKSRAFDGRPRRNQVTFRSALRFQFLGHQK